MTRGTERVNSEKIEHLKESYEMLWHLWSAGSGQYHDLTYTYLTALSILMAAAAITLQAGCQNPWVYTLTAVLSVGGALLCIQMEIAAGRLTAQNMYWERSLQEIECHPGWDRHPYFTEWQGHREKQEPVWWQRQLYTFKPNPAMRLHRCRWATRWRMIPNIFGGLYVSFFLASIALGCFSGVVGIPLAFIAAGTGYAGGWIRADALHCLELPRPPCSESTPVMLWVLGGLSVCFFLASITLRCCSGPVGILLAITAAGAGYAAGWIRADTLHSRNAGV